MTALDGNDKRTVHKMVRHLMKHGTWEAELSSNGYLQKLRCGAVLIDRYGSDGHVKVVVGGIELTHSFFAAWGSLGWSAERFFRKRGDIEHTQYLRDCFAKARAALLKAEG
ncbi:MAG TPA: hypothetical protein DCL54_03915 [Alphaproteobacteria bacterium]|nr:hypothetical protein [Alphaproteobacteria bacterium]HAJ45711.1 hypothetical protein [Alphaproteobacteria bacterium]